VATAFYHSRPLLPPVQDLVYLSVMLAVGTVVYRLAQAGPEAVRLLRWSALAASLVLGLGMAISMAVNGVNPVVVFASTIASGDPEVLQRELFRTAFVGFGLDEEDVSGGGLLLYRASLFLGAGLLLVSMSRAVLIAALVWPLLGLFRLVVSGRMRPGHVALVAVTAVGLLAATAAGFLQVIWFRFTADTSSYEARNGLYDLSVENIRNSPLTGGAETAGASAHNFVVDSWQRSGILAALAAAVMVVILLGVFFALAARIAEEPDWMVPVAAALALPLIRIFTAGGGLITPVSWIVLGFVVGVIAYRTSMSLPAISAAAGQHGTGTPGVPARRDPVPHV
jgi:O-antigen ligase